MLAITGSELPARRALALTVAFSIFLLVVITATLVTFIMPERYLGVARVHVRTGASPADEAYVVRSAPVLSAVAQTLDLKNELGRQYGIDAWKEQEVLAWLNLVINVTPVRNTSLLEIRAYQDQPVRAAQIANAVAESYCGRSQGAEVVDQAMPPLRPAQPNKPLNLILGGVVGLLLGGMAAGIVFVAGAIRDSRRFASRRSNPPVRKE